MFEQKKPLNGNCDTFELSHKWGSPHIVSHYAHAYLSINLRQLRDTRRLKERLRAGKTVELRERDSPLVSPEKADLVCHHQLLRSGSNGPLPDGEQRIETSQVPRDST